MYLKLFFCVNDGASQAEMRKGIVAPRDGARGRTHVPGSFGSTILRSVLVRHADAATLFLVDA